jgi:hypothetical protein
VRLSDGQRHQATITVTGEVKGRGGGGGHRWGQALASLRKKGFVQPTIKQGGGGQRSRRIVFACFES